MVVQAFLWLYSGRLRPSLAGVAIPRPRKVSMPSSYRPPAVGATFRQFLNGFLQTDGLPFRDVLTTTHIEQIPAAEKVSFGTRPDDAYSVPLTLRAFITQVASHQKSSLPPFAPLLLLLPIPAPPP